MPLNPPSELRTLMFSLLQGMIEPHFGQLTRLPIIVEESNESISPKKIGETNHSLQLIHCISIDFTSLIIISTSLI